MRELLTVVRDMDLRETPPQMGQRIHRKIRELTGDVDPYRVIKGQFNRVALELYPSLVQRIEASDDPFETAVRLAIAGNSIDLAAYSGMTASAVTGIIEDASHKPITGSIDELRDAINRSGNILYLGDNAGEIVFDRLLIEQLPRERITFAVRGRPVLNDATLADAEAVGLTELVDVIDNGSDVPGTILEDCSPVFRDRFARADLIIAKGMGNYETLSGMDGAPIVFLLIAKCPIVARDLGCDLGTYVIRCGREKIQEESEDC